MKKQLSLILVLFLLAGLLSACGAGSVPAPSVSSSTPAPAAAAAAEASEEPAPETTAEPSPEPSSEPAPETTPEPSPEPSPEPTSEPSPEGDPSPLQPMLWKLSDTDGHTLYLFGTIHVGDERSTEVLEKLSPLLLSCDALAVEFDAVAYQQDLGAVMADYKQFVYSDDSTVRDHMPQELYERCAALLTEAKAYSPLLDHYNLAMWSNLVESAAMVTQSPLQADDAMDLMLIQRAYDNKLPVLDVESASFQMKLLNSFPEELNLLMIQSTLDNLESYGESIDALYAAWLKGDYDEFLALFLAEDDVEDLSEAERDMVADYNKAMVEDRNLGMAEVAAGYLRSGDTVFMAVGTGHLVGDTGLVQLLQDAGFTAERVKY